MTTKLKLTPEMLERLKNCTGFEIGNTFVYVPKDFRRKYKGLTAPFIGEKGANAQPIEVGGHVAGGADDGLVGSGTFAAAAPGGFAAFAAGRRRARTAARRGTAARTTRRTRRRGTAAR